MTAHTLFTFLNIVFGQANLPTRSFQESLYRRAVGRVLVDHLTLVMYKCRYCIHYALLCDCWKSIALGSKLQMSAELLATMWFSLSQFDVWQESTSKHHEKNLVASINALLTCQNQTSPSRHHDVPIGHWNNALSAHRLVSILRSMLMTPEHRSQNRTMYKQFCRKLIIPATG